MSKNSIKGSFILQLNMNQLLTYPEYTRLFLFSHLGGTSRFMTIDLPAEVWTQIFTLAADEDLIFQYALPTSMADSVWFKNINRDWTLRTPQEAANLLQRRSYRTKKAIILTCKRWYEIASELLFRCLYFNNPAKLLDLCKILDTSSASATTITSSYGWWTRRLHVCRYYASDRQGTTMEDMENALVSIISHCPNLEVFLVDWPMGETFGPIADALARYAKRSLRTVHWNIPCSALSKVIWALDSLKYIVAAHIDFENPTSDDEECVNLGSAYDLHLSLRNLHQLSVRGYVQEFLEQATGWSIPSLKSFSIDSGNGRNDTPDVCGFLTHHGAGLEFLDLNIIIPLDVPTILDFCPQLTTFAFNADWRITLNHAGESLLTNRPRSNITTIGLHGLLYAFGVGITAEYSSIEPLRSRMIQESNDMNVAALNKNNFPNLQRVRALSKTMLLDLHKAGQPSQESGGMDRWSKWWDLCAMAGIRLEDCTGDFLGNLPEIDVDDIAIPRIVVGDEDGSFEESDSDEDEEDEDEEDEDDEDEDDAWNFRIPPMPEDHPGERTSELRQLLEECRLMAQEREEEPMFPPMFPVMGMMGGMASGMNYNSLPNMSMGSMNSNTAFGGSTGTGSYKVGASR